MNKFIDEEEAYNNEIFQQWLIDEAKKTAKNMQAINEDAFPTHPPRPINRDRLDAIASLFDELKGFSSDSRYQKIVNELEKIL